ncbi:MAG: glycosyltransferase, partial [Gemmatimonadales bacterium]|nr:glycosyltransferase [Gemmatimonadales bacterium]
TAERARDIPLRHVRVVSRPHRGKGAILSACIREAQGELVAFIDADLEIPPRYLRNLLTAVGNGSDIAIGSKTMDPDAAGRRPVSRRLATLGFNGLVWLLFRSPIHDHQAGIKLFNRAQVTAVLDDVQSAGWLWDTEVLLRLVRRGYGVTEIPVLTRPTRVTKVSMVRTSWEMFRGLLGLYFVLRRDRAGDRHAA